VMRADARAPARTDRHFMLDPFPVSSATIFCHCGESSESGIYPSAS
jgi:hypothetical protein